MADTLTTKKVTELAENTAMSDNDLFMVGSAGTASLRRLKWSNIWNTIKTAILGKLVANNLTTTATGYLLDARQGKALDDKISKLNTDSGTGYCRFHDGTQIVTMDIPSTTKTTNSYGSVEFAVTFPKEFISTECLYVNFIETTINFANMVHARYHTTTGCTITLLGANQGANASVTFSGKLIAIGRWK